MAEEEKTAEQVQERVWREELKKILAKYKEELITNVAKRMKEMGQMK